MKIAAQYASADKLLANAQITDIEAGDTPFDYGPALSLVDVNLTAGTFWAETIAAWIAAGGAPAPYVAAGAQSVLSQDLMAQFSADDAAKIQAAVGANPQFWLLWSSLQAQKDPMEVGNARFVAGWHALVSVLGQPRMDAIGATLGITVA